MSDFNPFAALAASSRETSRIYGVVVGVVTNNQDPEGLGRVKLRLPWLSAQAESDWARVISPMAGGDRGLYALPEVDDEVLVAFEHGRAELPYVLGSLWNGKDKPPAANEDGKNKLRVLKSRSGHRVRLDDTAGG
ncbi:MAG TPA: phage baseplate assembly protein V, partial [Thermoanaerobaculia bacterium]|nr:phage baseplate assembly protein V [Thermoanaerobaculia bacterium]